MHFTTLFILKGKELEQTNKYEIEEEFCKRFCYCCGETTPIYRCWCDWFKVGGRWNDSNTLIAKKGLYGDNGAGDGYGKPTFAIAEIKDLLADIDKKMIYAIATKTKIIEQDEKEFDKLLNQINKKEIKGIVALIDCHD